MSFEPVQFLRAGQAQHGEGADRGACACVARVLADYRRPSVWGPLVSVPVTSAYPCGAVSAGCAVANERHRGPSRRRAGCRLIITREDKGVVDK